MQTITTENQSSFNSETNVQIMSVFQSQMQTSTSVNPTENSGSVPNLEFHSSYLTSTKSSLILNSIYFMQEKIQNMLQVYFRKNKLQSRKCSDCTKLSNQISIIQT